MPPFLGTVPHTRFQAADQLLRLFYCPPFLIRPGRQEIRCFFSLRFYAIAGKVLQEPKSVMQWEDNGGVMECWSIGVMMRVQRGGSTTRRFDSLSAGFLIRDGAARGANGVLECWNGKRLLGDPAWQRAPVGSRRTWICASEGSSCSKARAVDAIFRLGQLGSCPCSILSSPDFPATLS